MAAFGLLVIFVGSVAAAADGDPKKVAGAQKSEKPNAERGIPKGKTLGKPQEKTRDTTETLRGPLPKPRVLGYDVKNDTFRRQGSVLIPDPKPNPGYYHGNRLNAFRYTGHLNRSGIYGAFEYQKRLWNHDPDGYRYRMR